MAKRAASSNAQPSLPKFKDRAFRSHKQVSLYIQYRPLIALAAFAHCIDFTCPVVGAIQNEGVIIAKTTFLRFRFLSRTPDHHFLRHAGPSNSAFFQEDMAESVHLGVLRPSGHRSVRGIARQACDGCRLRKAKCDTSNCLVRSSPDLDQPNHSRSPARQCQRCASLGLACTFLLPSRTRGPRRKYVWLNILCGLAN